MKFSSLILFILFPFLTQSQDTNSELKNKINTIDSIVQLTNSMRNSYEDGIKEGETINKNKSKENGEWIIKYLYQEDNENTPVWIKYIDSDNQSKDHFEFYFHKGKLIYAQLKIDFKKGMRKNKPIEKTYYFKNAQLISDSNPKMKKYGGSYISQKEKNALTLIAL